MDANSILQSMVEALLSWLKLYEQVLLNVVLLLDWKAILWTAADSFHVSRARSWSVTRA